MDRRKFISSSALAYICLHLSNSTIGQVVSQATGLPLTETIAEKLKRAADIRKAAISNEPLSPPTEGFQTFSSTPAESPPDLNEALEIYEEILGLNDLEFRAYDGIRKILLNEKYNELEVLNLFTEALNLYTTNPTFKERVAKEYMRLALGNKKFTDQISPGEDLLETAIELFDQARTADPENQQFETQFEKAERKLDQDATTMDARDNPKLKLQRRINRTRYQNRFEHLPAVEVNKRLVILKAKRYNPDRIHHIRDTYKIYIQKLIDEQSYNLAAQKVIELYDVDKNDPNSLYIIRNFCNEHQYYRELEAVERHNDSVKETVFSKIALFDVLCKQYEKDRTGDPIEMQDMLIELRPEEKVFTQEFEIKSREIKLELILDNYNSVRTKLISFAERITGITSAHWIDRFNYLCVSYYRKMGELEKASITINIALRMNDLPLEDLLLQKVEIVNRRKIVEKEIHNVRLEQLRSKLY